jgi:hypothetical protein
MSKATIVDFVRGPEGWAIAGHAYAFGVGVRLDLVVHGPADQEHWIDAQRIERIMTTMLTALKAEIEADVAAVTVRP